MQSYEFPTDIVDRFLLQPIADIRRMLAKDQEEAEEKIRSIEVCVCVLYRMRNIIPI